MLSIRTLASGSSGNLAVVSSRRTTILLDIGMSSQSAMAASLAQAGVRPGAVDAALVSHSHSDHLGYPGLRFCVKTGIPILAAPGCAETAERLYLSHLGTPPPRDAVRLLRCSTTYLIGDIAVTGFAVPHDAPTFGFVLSVRDNGLSRKVAVATDLGCAPDDLVRHFADADAILIESNYNDELLRRSNRHPEDKARVASDRGHLSNVQSGEFIRRVADASVSLPRSITLVHLSQDHNRPDIAVGDFIGATRLPSRLLPPVHAAPRHHAGIEVVV